MRHGTLLIGAALLLAACDSSTTASGPQAGGEDFPNTVNAMGRTLALGMDSTKDWNGLDSASTDAGTAAPDLGNPGSAAGRVRVAARTLGILCNSDSNVVFIDGTKAGWQKTICTDNRPGWKIHDSLVVGNYPNFLTEGLDTVYWSSDDSLQPGIGYENYSTILDATGRGYFRLKADTGRVRITSRRTMNGWTDFSSLVASGGADNLLGTGNDNAIWSGTRTFLHGSDTVWTLSVETAWPEVPLIGGAGDSGLARVTKRTNLVVGFRRETGLIMAHRDTTRNYAEFWSALTDRTALGYTRFQTAYGPRSDSSFRARDTVRLLDRFRAVAGLDSARTDVVAIMGPTLFDHSKDSVVSLRYERYRTALNERHTLWQIQSDNPVANGTESKSGSIYAHVDFADGTYAQFHGRWGTQIFTGTWSNGKDSATVVVKRDGTVVSMTKL